MVVTRGAAGGPTEGGAVGAESGRCDRSREGGGLVDAGMAEGGKRDQSSLGPGLASREPRGTVY